MNFGTNVKYNSDKNIKKALGGIGIYLVFITATTVVTGSTRHEYMFYFNDAIRYHISIRENFLSESEWWVLLSGIITPILKLSAETPDTNNDSSPNGNASTQNARDPLIMGKNFALGAPRLRQMRVVSRKCSDLRSFVKPFHSICYPLYSFWDKQTGGEHVGTEYKSAFELSSMPINGRIHYYWGGSYVQYFRRNKDETVSILLDLQRLGWLDRGTRLMVYEFTLFNNSTDLFNNAKVIGEVTATGGVFYFLDMKILQKYAVWTGSIWILLTAVVFYLMAAYYIFGEVRVMLERGCKTYIKNFWNLINLIILFLITLSFFYSIFHPIYMHYYLKQLEAEPNEYHSLDILCWLNKHYMNVMAVLTFLVWVKMFAFFSFNKVAVQLNMTFAKCYKDLLGFLVVFFVLFLSYAVLGMLLFGNDHHDFYLFFKAYWAVMRMVLADFDYTGVEKANRVLGPLYFVSFIIIVYFILINMFLAIIFDTFREVKKVEIPPEDNQLRQFFKKYWDEGKNGAKQLLNTMGLTKPKRPSKSGERQRKVDSDNEPPFPPTPKPPKEQVTKDELIKNYFEAVKNKREAEQIDKLTKHIAALEELLVKMNDDIKRLEAETPDPSTRPDQPRQGKAPPRVKVFVNRKK
ncbi:polycystic kidney disease 2-like 1 protein [Anastrepha ludens]|uniref:polycystic kidney disease 2-like 1 protein n=1 Tax=Anastrepha ludens TaxID=28586 RepID=UPI0023B11D75|nr:polycystic kidney disease 2-like 1 protein [Anastrepha ludens]